MFNFRFDLPDDLGDGWPTAKKGPEINGTARNMLHNTRFNAGMIEIRPNPMSIAIIRVKTPALVVLSAISPFRAVNDFNSFNIGRIGQPMC